MLNIPTLLDSVIENDKNEFNIEMRSSDALLQTESANNNVEIDNSNGAVAFQISVTANNKCLTNLLNNNVRYCTNDILKNVENQHSLKSELLLNNVTNKIIELPGKKPFAECLKIIKAFKNKSGKYFYGALMRCADESSNMVINPYHILTCITILQNYDFYKNMEFKIMIYVYKDLSILEHMERIQKNVIDDKHHIDSLIEYNINNQIALISQIVDISSIIESVKTDDKNTDNYIVTSRDIILPKTSIGDIILENLSITDNTAYNKLSESVVNLNNNEHTENLINNNSQNYKFNNADIVTVVATQILSTTLIAPYYGTEIVVWSNNKASCSGINITPMHSCNLSSDTNTDASKPPRISSSVCTGSRNKLTTRGLKTLHYANLNSPYVRNSVKPFAIKFANKMIEKCIGLYALLEKQTENITKVSTVKNQNCEKIPSTIKTFVEFMEYKTKNGKLPIYNFLELKIQWATLCKEKLNEK